MLTTSLRKELILASLGKRSSNSCEYITQWKIEMPILPVLNILSHRMHTMCKPFSRFTMWIGRLISLWFGRCDWSWQFQFFFFRLFYLFIYLFYVIINYIYCPCCCCCCCCCFLLLFHSSSFLFILLLLLYFIVGCNCFCCWFRYCYFTFIHYCFIAYLLLLLFLSLLLLSNLLANCESNLIYWYYDLSDLALISVVWLLFQETKREREKKREICKEERHVSTEATCWNFDGKKYFLYYIHGNINNKVKRVTSLLSIIRISTYPT